MASTTSTSRCSRATTWCDTDWSATSSTPTAGGTRPRTSTFDAARAAPANEAADEPPTMTVEVNDESGDSVDAPRLAAVSRFVLDRLRIHPLAELSVLAVDTDTMSSLHEKWMDE